MTRVLVLGRQGQLARALAASVWPADWNVEFAGRDALDMNRLEDISPFLKQQAPDLVINTAAFTAVDRAESEPEAAFLLNADASSIVAQSCRQMGGLLIHLSTDYVFGGAGAGPFSEDMPVAPMNVYGRSKSEGEIRVRSEDPDATVARTSWLMSAGSGFLAVILSRALRDGELRVVTDQRGTPTLASDLAQSLIRVGADRLRGAGQAGLLHMSGAADATWYDLAQLAIEATGLNVVLNPALSSDYVLPAQRPKDSRLCTMRLQQNHDIELSPWPEWVPDAARDGLNSAANCVGLGQQSGG